MWFESYMDFSYLFVPAANEPNKKHTKTVCPCKQGIFTQPDHGSLNFKSQIKPRLNKIAIAFMPHLKTSDRSDQACKTCPFSIDIFLILPYKNMDVKALVVLCIYIINTINIIIFYF